MQTNRGLSLIRWLAILIALGMAGAYGFRYWKSSDSTAVEYRTAKVTRGVIIQQVTANGALHPVRNVEVGSQISGTITAVNVDFNSKVREGEVIARLIPRPTNGLCCRSKRN